MAAKQLIHFRLGTQPGPLNFPDRRRLNSVGPFPPAVRGFPHPGSSAYARSSLSPNRGADQ